MERLGIAFSGGAGPAEIVECVKLAEALGYESAWVAEGHAGDQFAVLAACARETSRIGLGTAITSVFVRTAPTIAMAAATVDDLDRKSTRLNSSHVSISYAVFCLKKKKKNASYHTCAHDDYRLGLLQIDLHYLDDT